MQYRVEPQDLSQVSTDDLQEGAVHLYFMGSRVYAAMSAADSILGWRFDENGNFRAITGAQRHIAWDPGSAGNIGALSASSGADYRPKKAFLSDALLVGNLLSVSPPYGLNNPLVTGLVGAGNSQHVAALIGANSTFFNGSDVGFLGFCKDGSAANTPAFFNENAAGDSDVYFGLGHRTAARENLLKFAYDGSVTLMKASGAHLLWSGVGDIGAPSGSSPRDVYADGKVYARSGLAVGNSSAATSVGSIVAKMPVYDASGNYLGVVAVHEDA